MKRCGARPYKGPEKYIFISYSHKDKPRVFPIIERLTRDGYRVWYDDGIDPGSEWPTTIAKHLKNCEVCIPLISENSLKSANCNQEITYALSKNKKMFAVMLEKVEMPDGLEMQLSVIQSVFKYTLTDEEFFSRVYEAEILRPCLGEPNPKIRVSTPEEYVEDESSGNDYSGRGSQRWSGSEKERKDRGKDTFGGDGRKDGEKGNPQNIGGKDGGKQNPQDNGRKEDGAVIRGAGEIHQKNKKGKHGKYTLPGYRSGKMWHKVLATCYYAVMVGLMALSISFGMPLSILFMLYVAVLFLGCAAIWGNYLDCWQKIPLMKGKKGRILGFVIYPVLLYFVLALLFAIMIMATGMA